MPGRFVSSEAGLELLVELWRKTDTALRPGTAGRLEAGTGWYLNTTDREAGTTAGGMEAP